MEAPQARQWFLRKHEDGGIFGPLTFAQLEHWASAAQIAPHDLLSADQEAWIKAPMLPELQMDWLVEITSDQYYGPTTLGAIEHFLRLGEINGETWIINSCDGARQQINELPALFRKERRAPGENAGETDTGPEATSMSIDLHERISSLEQTLREERRALVQVEERYRDLLERYEELLAQTTGR